MESVIPKEKSGKVMIKTTNFIKLSNINNGFLKQWIQTHYNRERNPESIFSYKAILRLIFMTLLLIRVLKLMTIRDNMNRVLIYFGNPFQYLGGNRFHYELLIVSWTLYFIVTHIFVIYSHNKQYKWLEIFAFLTGFSIFTQIGIT